MTKRDAKEWSLEEIQAAFNEGQRNPVTRLLNEVSLADTQQEVADLLATHRDVLRTLSREDLAKTLKEIAEMVDEKPETDDLDAT
jgi:hypothetical protein